MFKIQAFRAIENEDLCTQFADGHAKVLLDYGVTKVTSSSRAWFHNPSVFVLIATNTQTGEVVGGVRLHVADGVHPLPFEEAISIVDVRVYELVKQYIPNKTAELCGLWNAKSTAGMGIGSYTLMRAGISVTNQLDLATLFALCAPHTLKISLEKGFQVETSIGNEGTFIYPKLDLIATSIMIRNTEKLSLALPEERELILSLRENPVMTRIEKSPKGEMEIEYNLLF